jgi:hypothetical protein
MTEMKSFKDFETKYSYSKSYLDKIRSYLEIEDVRANRSIGEYSIKRMENIFPLWKTLNYSVCGNKISIPKAKDIYVLVKRKSFLKKKEIALAFHYTSESESWHAPGRTNVASMLSKEELEEMIDETDIESRALTETWNQRRINKNERKI